VKTVVVRYETKPECADENRQLIEKVFAELAETKPAGLSYASFQLDDGVTFLHIAREDGTGSVGLNDVAAFKAFVANVGERCAVQPVAMGARIVGSYQFTLPAQ
jgi:hypothetical protein